MRIGKWDCDGIGIGMCHRSFMKFQYKIVVGETFDWKAWSFPSMYYEYVLYIYIYIYIYIHIYIYIYIYIHICVCVCPANFPWNSDFTRETYTFDREQL